MKTTRSMASVGMRMVLIASLLISTTCTHSRKKVAISLPSDYSVERNHGAKILTMAVGRGSVHYSLSELKVSPPLFAKEETQSGHWFEIGISGSCKLSGPPPEELVLDLTHWTANTSKWQFPSPMPSQDFKSPNASFDTVILADGSPIDLPRHYQSELKQITSNGTFYEELITEISRQDLVRIANSRVVAVRFSSLASFDLDNENIVALKDFATIVSRSPQ